MQKMKRSFVTALIFIFGWQVSCLPGNNSSCPTGLAPSSSKRIVLVIDVSASMESQEKLKEVGSVLKEWILNQKPCSAQLGIVQFNLIARTLCNLTEINEESRSDLVKRIPMLAQGSTCIPCGLREAIKVLGNVSKSMERPVIMLITDAVGSELDLDDDDFMHFMKASHVQVVVAVLSNESTIPNDIGKLTELTGGFSHYIQDENLQKELMEMLVDVGSLAIVNATTILPETTKEIAVLIPILNDTVSSTFSTTHTSNVSYSTEITDTLFEETIISQVSNNVPTVSMSTASVPIILNFSYSTSTSETTFEDNVTIVTSDTTTAPMEEALSSWWYLGIGVLIVIILVAAGFCLCCRKRHKRPCASHGSYAPIELKTRPIHGDQVLNYVVKPNSSYS